jgi:hypothetical protein
VNDNVFFATLEWADAGVRPRRFYMAGLSFEIDFNRCHARRIGTILWKAEYKLFD